MRIDLLETQAAMLSRAALFCDYTMTPIQRKEEVGRLYALASGLLFQVQLRSKQRRVKRRIDKALHGIRYYQERQRQSELYGLEARAKRREDREAWEADGWRVLTVFDSYTHSTQPDPLYVASRQARDVQEWLDKQGHQNRTEVPDYKPSVSHFGPWGYCPTSASGHVVVLVKTETPMQLELIRREYAAYMDWYWLDMHQRYWPDKPYDASMWKTHFREW